MFLLIPNRLVFGLTSTNRISKVTLLSYRSHLGLGLVSRLNAHISNICRSLSTLPSLSNQVGETCQVCHGLFQRGIINLVVVSKYVDFKSCKQILNFLRAGGTVAVYANHKTGDLAAE